MTILDHRILIPKSPEKIWEFLSDLSQNSAWQVDCTSVSILTSKHTGPGVRWRYTTAGGRSYVAEITAWYDGLGYEYTFVDGTPFRENKGRIRLQEIAEGTVVQWTLTYETNGVLAGVRNAVGLKRQFEGAMVDSLKNLWKVLQKVMPEDKPREVKSLMRDAPDYESRTQYRPRHAPAKQETGEAPAPSSFAPNKIVEPPISMEDTRPRAPVKVDVPPVHEEPIAPAASIFSKPVDDPDTGAIEPVVYPLLVEKPPEAREFVPRKEEKPVESDTLSPARRTTQEMKSITVEPEAKPKPEPAPVEYDAPPEESPFAPPRSEPKPEPASSAPTTTSSFDTVKMATGEMSVFDLFGIPRPSQTQQIEPVVITEPTEAAVSESLSAPSAKPSRIGLRLVLRRKRVSLRRPS